MKMNITPMVMLGFIPSKNNLHPLTSLNIHYPQMATSCDIMMLWGLYS